MVASFIPTILRFFSKNWKIVVIVLFITSLIYFVNDYRKTKEEIVRLELKLCDLNEILVEKIDSIDFYRQYIGDITDNYAVDTSRLNMEIRIYSRDIINLNYKINKLLKDKNEKFINVSIDNDSLLNLFRAFLTKHYYSKKD